MRSVLQFPLFPIRSNSDVQKLPLNLLQKLIESLELFLLRSADPQVSHTHFHQSLVVSYPH